MNLTDAQIDIIVNHYFAAAIAIDLPDELRDDGHEYAPAPESVEKVRAGLLALCAAHGESVQEVLNAPGYGDSCAQEFGGERRAEWPYAAFGHDMYLTSQGHGAGFWDRTELHSVRGAARLTVALDYIEARGRAWNLNIDFDEVAHKVHAF